MKKNDGFIAMSLIYTFLMVFIVVLSSVLAYYINNNQTMYKLNKDIIIRYNEGLKGKELTKLYTDGIIKKGEFLYYPTNESNYNETGLWQILKGDTNNLYIISNFVVANIESLNFDVDTVRLSYDSTFLNNSVANNLHILTTSDLWPNSHSNLINSSNDYLLWNIGAQYFVKESDNNKIIAPNCSCSGTRSGVLNTSYYANDIPQYNSLNSWYDATCRTYSNLNQNTKNCPIRYINYSTSYPLNDEYISGLRLIIELKSNISLVGGSGNTTYPYQIGVIE